MPVTPVTQMPWPIRGTERTKGGELSVRELRRHHQPVYPGEYAPRGAELSASYLRRICDPAEPGPPG